MHIIKMLGLIKKSPPMLLHLVVTARNHDERFFPLIIILIGFPLFKNNFLVASTTLVSSQ